ncbi:MAG: hypothetical protein ACFFD2_09855 [Promethearchaeota archaeon]
MINFFRIKIASKVLTIRVFFYLFAVIIYNLWILYNLLHQIKQKTGYILLTPQVKMLFLLKALRILAAIMDKNLSQLAGGDVF